MADILRPQDAEAQDLDYIRSNLHLLSSAGRQKAQWLLAQANPAITPVNAEGVEPTKHKQA